MIFREFSILDSRFSISERKGRTKRSGGWNSGRSRAEARRHRGRAGSGPDRGRGVLYGRPGLADGEGRDARPAGPGLRIESRPGLVPVPADWPREDADFAKNGRARQIFFCGFCAFLWPTGRGFEDRGSAAACFPMQCYKIGGAKADGQGRPSLPSIVNGRVGPRLATRTGVPRDAPTWTGGPSALSRGQQTWASARNAPTSEDCVRS